MRWSRFTLEEVERRRKVSVANLKNIDQEAFARWYQEECDRQYWRNGQCCAGCDFWRSDSGRSGECTAAGIVPGADVLRSMGVVSSSWTPAPGFPFTRYTDWCGKFRDDFDWQSLGEAYLTKIGAIYKGRMQPAPRPPRHT